MITFLPFPDFQKSAEALDKRRCWKQTVEASQILKILRGQEARWQHHPAVRMWMDSEAWLVTYYNIFYNYSRSVHKIKTVKLHFDWSNLYTNIFNAPVWLGNPDFHISHQNRLAQKAFEDIQKRDDHSLYIALQNVGIVPENCDLEAKYVWPVK